MIFSTVFGSNTLFLIKTETEKMEKNHRTQHKIRLGNYKTLTPKLFYRKKKCKNKQTELCDGLLL